jgi:hypothetical protein
MSTATVLVRLKPYNKRKGHLRKTYSVNGATFHAGNWYRVSRDMAEYLEGIRARDEDEIAPLSFDVCSEKEAKDLVEREKLAARKQSEPDDAITIKDLTPNKTTKPSTEEDGVFDEKSPEPGAVVEIPGAPKRGSARGRPRKGRIGR